MEVLITTIGPIEEVGIRMTGVGVTILEPRRIEPPGPPIGVE
jgi:hypothetical protein